jgi:two-component system, NarL family, invasion response regulator UvrY
MSIPGQKIKIALIDDHNLFRKGLIKLINMGDVHQRYTVIFEAENGKDMQEKISKKNLPDIILMDIDMPDMDGFEAVDWLKNFHPDIQILVISMFENKSSIVRMLRLGVNGYLSKDIEVEDMHKALESIITRGFYYSEGVSELMAQALKEGEEEGELHEGNKLIAELSEKEREFLKWACTDLTYQLIADKMQLSVKTIDGYRETLFQKFNVKNRIGLAIFAIKNGLVKI